MLKVYAVLAFVVMVTCNALANSMPINGLTTGEISDAYPNLFAPIGFTFSIWGVIYTLLAIFCVLQFSKAAQKSKIAAPLLQRILPFFVASSILNSLWIFAWHYKHIGLSVVLITLILLCLMRIAWILQGRTYTLKEYTWLRLPFSIYFGWISVAVIADITTWLVSIGWSGLGLRESFWTIAVLVLGALVAIITAQHNKDPAYLLVFVWAYLGILAKHLAPSGFNGQYESVIAVLVLLLGTFVYALSRLGSKRQLLS